MRWAARALALALGIATGFMMGMAPGATTQAQEIRIERVEPRPLLLDKGTGVRAREVAPLDADQLKRLRQAQSFRDAGLDDKAKATLEALLNDLPHHPLVLTELARLFLATQDFAAVERLARPERTAQKDSLLLGRELALALERLGKIRDAAQVAVEVWAAAPAEGGWAGETMIRLGAADPRAAREPLQRAVDRLPHRTEMAYGLSRVLWKAGDSKAALRALFAADRPVERTPLRWSFADDLIRSSAPRDSAGAAESLLDLAGDTRFDVGYRLPAARRAWHIYASRGAEAEGAPRVARALEDVQVSQWNPELVVAVSRGLRQAGLTGKARALLESSGAGRGAFPQVEIERALADLHSGPPARSLPRLRAIAEGSQEGAYRYSEALFFAGEIDSALSWYQRVASDPRGVFAGAALERIYLLEEGAPSEALPVLGRMAYEEWRGETRRALVLADSLHRSLPPRSTLRAHAAIELSKLREASGEWNAALEPLLALADSSPQDRLAPLARQRAGELYLVRLKDEAKALAQFEECLARYPRAWNAAEVRRRVEQIRRERRF